MPGPGVPSLRSWAVVGTGDKVIPVNAQLSMARHAGARVTEINAGHLSLIERPDVVTGVIEEAARATN